MANERAGSYARLRDYQLGIAREWQRRAALIPDDFARFMFLFAGFNALYALLKIESSSRKVDEKEDIDRLISRLGQEATARILRGSWSALVFFGERSIIAMHRRTLESTEGDLHAGQLLRERIASPSTPTDQLSAMAQVLYLIRCNLVHGSKQQSGTDAEIVQEALRPLELILDESLQYVEEQTLTLPD